VDTSLRLFAMQGTKHHVIYGSNNFDSSCCEFTFMYRDWNLQIRSPWIQRNQKSD